MRPKGAADGPGSWTAPSSVPARLRGSGRCRRAVGRGFNGTYGTGGIDGTGGTYGTGGTNARACAGRSVLDRVSRWSRGQRVRGRGGVGGHGNQGVDVSDAGRPAVRRATGVR